MMTPRTPSVSWMARKIACSVSSRFRLLLVDVRNAMEQMHVGHVYNHPALPCHRSRKSPYHFGTRSASRRRYTTASTPAHTSNMKPTTGSS